MCGVNDWTPLAFAGNLRAVKCHGTKCISNCSTTRRSMAMCGLIETSVGPRIKPFAIGSCINAKDSPKRQSIVSSIDFFKRLEVCRIVGIDRLRPDTCPRVLHCWIWKVDRHRQHWSRQLFSLGLWHHLLCSNLTVAGSKTPFRICRAITCMCRQCSSVPMPVRRPCKALVMPKLSMTMLHHLEVI